MTVPYTGSTALQPSAPNCEPPEVPKRGIRLRSVRWWSGHIDLGELGVATAATGAEFFAACGVEPDRARIDYYRRSWRAEDAASR